MSDRILNVLYFPRIFRGGSHPAGFKYCLGLGHKQKRECVSHGLVFGDLAAVMAEIKKEMSFENLTAVLSKFSIPSFPTCADAEKNRYLRGIPQLPRHPGRGAPEIEVRMYNAKLALLAKNNPEYRAVILSRLKSP